jgi:hypothetical protein
MAKFVMRDAYIQVNNVDLSDHCSSLTVESTADDVDLTAFTTAGYREYGVGFKSATITATFFQDYGAASVHSVLQPLYDTSGTFPVRVKASQQATSATNPRIELPVARMFGYNPLAGGVGDAASFDTEFRNAGTAGITYSTSGTP